MSEKIQFESEEQLFNFIDKVFVSVGRSFSITETIAKAKQLGYIKKSPLQQKVEEAEEILQDASKLLERNTYAAIIGEHVQIISEAIQLLKAGHPEFKEVI